MLRCRVSSLSSEVEAEARMLVYSPVEEMEFIQRRLSGQAAVLCCLNFQHTMGRNRRLHERVLSCKGSLSSASGEAHARGSRPRPGGRVGWWWCLILTELSRTTLRYWSSSSPMISSSTNYLVPAVNISKTLFLIPYGKKL